MYLKAFLIPFLILPLWVSAGTLNSLSSEENHTLQKGKLVLKTVKIKDSPWPKIQIVTKVNASPFDAMAIFLAYDHQKNYVPNILVSQPIKQPGPGVVWVKYVLDVPWPLPNSEYVHSHRLEQKPDGFQVHWKMEESDTSDFTEGSAYFFREKDQTYLVYNSQIRPKSIFASFVKKFMVKDTVEAVQKIKSYIEKSENSFPKIFKKYQNFLKLTLQGKKVYSPVIKEYLLKMKEEKLKSKEGNQRSKDR